MSKNSFGMYNVKKTTQRFTIDGKTYNSFDEIPEKFRKELDKDGNGKIDVLENTDFSGFEIDSENKSSSVGNDDNTRVIYTADDPTVDTFKNEGRFRMSATFELKDKFQVEMWKLILFGLLMFGIGAYVGYQGVL